ncbi:MAG TPA: tetratricopeptide repeat protein [Coleofasciculaceae cyanobacterium]|jgi:tetratricopeptide (TPR) repeat protein
MVQQIAQGLIPWREHSILSEKLLFRFSQKPRSTKCYVVTLSISAVLLTLGATPALPLPILQPLPESLNLPKLQQLLPTSPDDKNSAVRRIYIEAGKLHEQGTEESLRQAIKKYEESLPLWRTAGDQYYEAATLNNIGSIYSRLGEKQKALDYHNQALPLWRAVSNLREEATTLTNIANVYAQLGEKQKSLDYFNQAVPLWRRAISENNRKTTN